MRKFLFWGAVAGTAVLAQFGVELAAQKLPWPGLRRFVDYIHAREA